MLLLVGYLVTLISPDIFSLLASTLIRAVGSNVLWMYSTLLLQLRVPNHLLGRMLAVELAIYTVRRLCSSVGFVWEKDQRVRGRDSGVIFLQG